MTGKKNTPTIAVGAPVSHFNWQLAKSGREIETIYEYPLYTDAHIVGYLDRGCGPYQFLNAIPPPEKQRERPTVILRAEHYITVEHHKPGQGVDERTYHGGYLEDELAALLSLSLGVRFKSGDANRIFDGADDCRGQPVSFHTRLQPDPILPQVARHGTLIPSTLQKKNLEAAMRICRLESLSAKTASALIRAARLYQDALWIVESEPHLSWLMFTSAVETAAKCWQDETEEPVAQLESWGPGTDLMNLLESAGQGELIESVAELLSGYTGARQAFLRFLLTYVPKPPKKRPPESFQCLWSEQGLRKMFSQIYEYRSRALHDGTAFPAPMCLPPLPEVDGAHPEKPLGLQIGVLAAWSAKELPMHIHVFEYIVRNALLTWWDKILASTTSSGRIENGHPE